MSNNGMKRVEKLWEQESFTEEENIVMKENFFLLEDFYNAYRISDGNERDFFMDRFLIACKRYKDHKIFDLKKYLNACLHASRTHYWLNAIRNNRKCKLFCESSIEEEQYVYNLTEKFIISEDKKEKTAEEIFAHQFMCNLKPLHQKIIYYRFYYAAEGITTRGLDWQGVAVMMGTQKSSVKNIFSTIKKLAVEEVFIDCGADGYGSKILNKKTMKIKDKKPTKDLCDIFKEVGEQDA